MPNFFYTDKNGTKHSLTAEQLQALVHRGTITPNTPLETDTGHQGLAGQIPGLKFPTTVPSPFAQPAQTSPPSANLFCTNCGNPISEHAVACMSCGAKPVGHRKFCRHCAAALNPEQVICIKCGAGISAAGASRSGGGMATGGGGAPKNKIVAAILAFFLGELGIHWFYLGEKNKAVTYLGVFIGSLVLCLIFIGLIGVVVMVILALIDTIKLLMMSNEDFDAMYNS